MHDICHSKLRIYQNLISAFSERKSVGEGGIWDNDSTKTRLVGEIVVDRRGGAGGSRGGTGYSSNSAMNHGNNVDNKPSRKTSDSSTVHNLGFAHLGLLLLLSFVLV